MTLDWTEAHMQASLRQRQEKGTLRRLPAAPTVDQDFSLLAQSNNNNNKQQKQQNVIDFSSNDYLGLAHSESQARRVEELYATAQQQQKQGGGCPRFLGATGSRLLSGDSPAFHQLEQYLAVLHEQPAALLCNSGYDANLSLVSSLPCRIILYDEYAHNSLHMAMRLWHSRDPTSRQLLAFRHNSVSDLRQKLQKCPNVGGVVIVVESVYSMDGDCAPLADILQHATTHDARVMVDEAHGLGASGPTGLLAALGLHRHPALMAAVYTFGKAAGCHGAVITGSRTLKSYLVNFGYPLIYSTALPLHSLCTIRASYETMTSTRGDELRLHLQDLIRLFQEQMGHKVLENRQWSKDVSLIASTTAIQALVVPGNQRCSDFCQTLWRKSNQRIRLFPIKSPTVPSGMERVRIVLHAHNSVAQVLDLVDLVRVSLHDLAPDKCPTSSKL